jgi:Ni,Fe-hydrogenase I cytochrome b subunit
MKPTSPPKYSLGLRIWHWLDGLVVLGLLLTFLLRETLFSVRANRDMFLQKLGEQQITLTEAQARDLARELMHHLWAWHINLGYVLTALLLWRVILFFFEEENAFMATLRGARRLPKSLDFRSLHSTGVKLLYSVFYLAQTFMVLSGLTMVFGKSMGLSHDFTHGLHEIHETVMWFFLFFVIVHVAGVVTAENTTDPGLASEMINGGRRDGSRR